MSTGTCHVMNKEMESLDCEVVDQSPLVLGSYDVLCGRDKNAFNNIGNRRFRVTVALALDNYVNVAKSRKEKSNVIRGIIESTKACNGRFLMDRDGQLVELNDRETHEKVGHAIRDMANARAKGKTNALQLCLPDICTTKSDSETTSKEEIEKSELKESFETCFQELCTIESKPLQQIGSNSENIVCTQSIARVKNDSLNIDFIPRMGFHVAPIMSRRLSLDSVLSMMESISIEPCPTMDCMDNNSLSEPFARDHQFCEFIDENKLYFDSSCQPEGDDPVLEFGLEYDSCSMDDSTIAMMRSYGRRGSLNTFFSGTQRDSMGKVLYCDNRRGSMGTYTSFGRRGSVGTFSCGRRDSMGTHSSYCGSIHTFTSYGTSRINGNNRNFSTPWLNGINNFYIWTSLIDEYRQFRILLKTSNI